MFIPGDKVISKITGYVYQVVDVVKVNGQGTIPTVVVKLQNDEWWPASRFNLWVKNESTASKANIKEQIKKLVDQL